MSGSPPATVLLLGPEAEALAPRLEASGYRIATAQDSPDLVVLAAGEAGQIPALRQRFGSVPLLLDGGADDLAARSRCLLASWDCGGTPTRGGGG